MKINDKLKTLRKKHGFTQEELASQLFVTKQAVYKWEVGKNYPDINNLIRISDIYDLKIDDLLDESIDINNIENRKGVFLVNSQSKENLKTYINWLPVIGLVTSIIVFTAFFGFIGVNDNDLLSATLYCLLPFIVFTLIYIPLKLVMKKSRTNQS